MTQIACHECDVLLNLPEIEEGQRAYCPRCNHLISSHPHGGMERSLSFAISAVIFLGITSMYPFLALKSHGLESVMTLLQSATTLYQEGDELLAAFVLIFIIIAPLLILLCIIWTLGYLVFTGKRAPGAYGLAHIISVVTPWGMAEIFLMGILVAMVKIVSLATVVLDFSFWSYVGFTICFTLSLINLDQHYYWNALEKAKPWQVQH
jgi:paraquat-inducible protein A